MASRFSSGSVIPFRAAKNAFRAGMISTVTPICLEEGRDPLRFSLPHEAVVDETGFQTVPQGPVSQGGDDR